MIPAELFAAACALGVSFIFGTWYGLYLNLTHWHRMGRWAERVCDLLDTETTAREVAPEREVVR